MNTNIKIDLDQLGVSFNSTDYRTIIGSLLYLTATRPDIVYVVGVCARFQANPKKIHRETTEKILRYLNT